MPSDLLLLVVRIQRYTNQLGKIMGVAAIGKFPVAVGACLMGEPVRFNGGSKRWPGVLNGLETVFEWQSFCPEMAIGLGVPREPIRLVGEPGNERAVVVNDMHRDVTEALLEKATEYLKAHPRLCGYILVKGSPSCGYQRVKRYHIAGHVEKADATGVFARALQNINPLLPLEDDGRLHDTVLRESFVLRVFAYGDWLSLQDNGLSLHRLIGFYSRYKYLVMSRDVNIYRHLGQLLASSTNKNIAELADELMRYLMRALTKPATRAGQVNALEHVRGYLKQNLQKDEKEEITRLIELYREGYVPFIVPMTLLQHHFRRHPNTYIGEQLFMQPYPQQLGLRNGI